MVLTQPVGADSRIPLYGGFQVKSSKILFSTVCALALFQGSVSLAQTEQSQLPPSTAVRPFQDDPSDPNQGLRDLMDLLVGVLSARFDAMGIPLKLEELLTEDQSKRELLLTQIHAENILKAMREAGKEPPAAAARFLENLREFRISHTFADERVRLQVLLKKWTGIAIKDSKLAAKNELTALGMPEVIKYTMSVKGQKVKLAADTPRKEHALRIRVKGGLGNLWFRELNMDFQDLSGEVNVGVIGNTVGGIAKFKLKEGAAPGENPIKITPDIMKSLKENLGLLLVFPFLFLLF
jgi:hypothetical protein